MFGFEAIIVDKFFDTFLHIDRTLPSPPFNVVSNIKHLELVFPAALRNMEEGKGDGCPSDLRH